MALRVGVISYLPDTEIRERRRVAVHKTLQDLKAVIPNGVTITVVAQNYRSGDRLDDIEYIDHQFGIGQCAARNELLTSFYNSDDDFMLYTDDDTAFYDRYNSKQLFEALQYHPDWFKYVDCFTGIEGRFTPFTAVNAALDLDNQFIFNPMQYCTSGEFRVLKNIRKYYGKEFYYDSGLKYGEDLHFRLKYLSQVNSFVCRNVICKSRGLVDNICTLHDTSLTDQEVLYRQVTEDVYKLLNIPKTKSGKWDLTSYKCRIPYLSISAKDGSVKSSKITTKSLF